MTTARKKTLLEQPSHLYIKYLEMAIEYKSRPEYYKWHDVSDDELASLIHEKSTHKETYYED